MPIYTCTTTASTLTSVTKASLATEIGDIHSAINHVPSSYVTVVFHELPPDAVYSGGAPASPVLVSSWVREGHPADETTRLATEIAAAVTRITRLPPKQVTVVIQPGPARFAVEFGHVLPEPGRETEWLAQLNSATTDAGADMSTQKIEGEFDMTTESTAASNGEPRGRIRRDATAGGGAPATGEHFAGDAEGTIMRAFLRAGGLSKEEVRRRPIIGICSSFSELNPCNMGLRDLAEAVRRGVTAAGGTAVVFPTISLNENMLKPTSMLLRNLMAMDVEEMIRCSPIDGVVLLAGCDKTVPAQLMGAASAGKPAIMLTAGPRSCGFFQGRSIVTTDIWDIAPDRFAGRIDDQEWDELEGTFAPTVGVCNVMGTATTMAVAAEVLGMALPGSAAVPAVEQRRRDLGERTGVRAVELARAGIRPDDRMTPDAFDNAIRVLSATGGSTNEFIHLTAIAGRLGISLGLDRFAAIGEQTPQVLGVRPSGEFALEDFDHAGGVPALLAVLEPLLDSDVVLGDGRTVAEIAAAVRSARPKPHPCLRSLDDPFLDKSGLVVLRGSLAPRGAIFKRSAAPRRFWTHRGPALVFDYHNAHERAKNLTLQASPDTVIVLRNAGIVGAPGMPEIDFVPIPAVLRQAGITELVCVTDGRMSGTEGGPTALHVTPEAAVGGPIGLVRDGDEIVLDAIAGTLDLLVDEQELVRRAAEAPPGASLPLRGYERLHAQHVLQADQGCDLDFLVDHDSHQQSGQAQLAEEIHL